MYVYSSLSEICILNLHLYSQLCWDLFGHLSIQLLGKHQWIRQRVRSVSCELVVERKSITYICDICSRFLTEHQAANLPVLLAAQSAVFDRGRQIGGLLWSANFPPRRVRLFLPRLLSKNEAAMCQPLREVSGGVDDHWCGTHSRGVLKPGNGWSQQSVHHFICRH